MNDLYRDIVWTEYMNEYNLSGQQMLERKHVDAMSKRVADMMWQDEQRTKWMYGEQPTYTVPDDCPF